MTRFNLKNKNSKDATLIFLYFYYDKNTLKRSTELKIQPQYWDFKKQCVRSNMKFLHAREYNQKLRTLKNKIESAYYQLQNQEEEINNRILEREAFGDKLVRNIDFYSYFERRYEQIKNERGYERAKQYNTVLGVLKAFKKGKFRFKDINIDYYHKLLDYMNNKGYKPNSQGTIIKKLKEIQKRAFEEKLHSNEDWRKFERIAEEVDNIYLTEDELKEIEECEVDPSLQLAKDVFLISCNTGLRFKDAVRIRPANINNNYLKIRASKDDDALIIPINSTVNKILTRYSNSIPAISQEKFNEKIKQVCQAAKIKTEIEIKSTKGREKKFKTYFKWEKVSSHTGRRSFCTNLFLGGVNPVSIIKLTGHSTVKQLLSYIKIDNHQNAELLEKIEFFQ